MAIARILRRAFVMAALMLAGFTVLGPPQGMRAAEEKPSRLVAVIDIKGAIGKDGVECGNGHPGRNMKWQ